MTIEEKLQHFYDVTIKNANDTRKKEVAAYQAALEKEYQEHVSIKNQLAQAEYEQAAARIRREANKELSGEIAVIRHHTSAEKDRIRDLLFEAVRSRLRAFKETPAYKEYLLKKIQEILEIAGNDHIEIYIDASDMNLSEEIFQKTGVRPMPAFEDIIGGAIGKDVSGKMLIFESFENALSEIEKEFDFEEDW